MARIRPIIFDSLIFTGSANLLKIVDEINQSISRVEDAGYDQVAEILKEIGQTALTDQRFGKRKRNATMIILHTLAYEATLPSAERDLIIIDAALAHLPSCLVGSLDMLNYLQFNFEKLRKFFNPPV